MELTTAAFLFISGSLYLIPILMWVWLRPNKLPKPRSTDDDSRDNPDPGLPLIPLPPGSPARWLTDRSEKNQKISSF